MGTFLTELEALYGDIVMWKYLIQDLLGTIKYAPGGILIGCLLYCLLVVARKKKGTENKNDFSVMEMLFWVYIAIIVVITFLSREGGSGGMDLRIGSSLGINARNDAYAVENILLFIPYGFLLGIVWKGEKRLFNCLCAGFLTSFGIELLQLISGRGVFQTDDLITNTIGAVVGYLFFYVCIGRRRKHTTVPGELTE